MEFCSASLEKYLEGQKVQGLLDWSAVREFDKIPEHAYGILQHIINGLLFIHFLREVHRDLSPQNGTHPITLLMLVLYQQGNWKIADFGLTSEATSNRLVTSISARGKPCYRAPELLREKGGYNNKADIWSLGCIGYELFTGQKAFRDDFHVFEYASARKPPKKLINQLTPTGKYYIQDLLEIDPVKRPSAKNLLRVKFRTEWEGIPPTSVSVIPSKRVFYPEPVLVRCQSNNLVTTLRWGASNPLHPEFFDTLLNIGKVTLPIFIPGALKLEGHKRNVKAEFKRPNDAFMALQAALAAGDIYTIRILLERTPEESEMNTALVGQYVTLWEAHLDLLKVLAERDIQIHPNDYPNKEALFRLAIKSPNRVAETIARIIPDCMKIPGKDWVAVLSPSNTRDLRVSLTHFIKCKGWLWGATIRFSNDGRHIACCFESDWPTGVEATIFETESGIEVGNIYHEISEELSCFTFGFGSDSWCLAVGLTSGEIIIRSLTKGNTRILRCHHDDIFAVEFSQDSSLIVSGADDCSVKLWDCITGQQLEVWAALETPLRLSISSDNTLVAAITYNGLYVWNRSATNRSFRYDDQPTSFVAFTPASNGVAVCSSGTVNFWNTDSEAPRTTQQSLGVFPNFQSSRNPLAFNSDGKWIGLHRESLVRLLSTDQKSHIILFSNTAWGAINCRDFNENC